MRYVIIGQKGDSQLLVVDTQQMTVIPIDSANVMPDKLHSMRAEGGAVSDGIDLAITADPREDGSSIWYFQGK
ncbi:hypothetical protein [Devosia sp.]|jgi:hypothetical protein|uniref:hypothetical protein n=1 Tax=Devosia sp. TaxID=1871048 RepID=UPI003BA8F9DF